MFDRETSAMEALEGPIQFTHQFVDMPKYEVDVEDPTSGTKKVRRRDYFLCSFLKKLQRLISTGETM